MKRLVLVLLVFCAVPAGAQEFDVFDFNDFLDPRLRGAEYAGNGNTIVQPGDDVQILRITTGIIRNYQWHNRPTEEEARFLHFAHSIYRGRNQWTGKLTALDGDGDSTVPRYRGTLQWGTYRLQKAKLSTDLEPQKIASRFLISATIEENRYKNVLIGRTRDYNTELGLQADVSLPLPRGRSVMGSLVYMTRDMGELGGAQRLTYFYRIDDRRIGEHLQFGATFGVGGEKTDKWHWGATRIGLLGAAELPWVGGTMNVVWTPTYVPGARERNVFHEVAVFFDRTLLTSIRARTQR